ncbi:MAG: MtnX-like HAD-IB family phosphatase [Desulfovibrio sp.]|nr:MtnX-like HAD-IB family phosphatase [Desulfovibrio sp.]
MESLRQQVNGQTAGYADALLQNGFYSGDWTVVCDFDGTITPYDVTDAILQCFALPEWEAAEEAWTGGRITARECMEIQVSLLRAPKKELDAFLDSVPVDESFGDFVALCRNAEVSLTIVSDGLDYAIQRILAAHGLENVPFVANRLVPQGGGRYRLEFPHGASDCPSGVCKCRAAESGAGGMLLIGDGRSDFCLARNSSFILAKQDRELLRHCWNTSYPHAAYSGFSDILSLFGTQKTDGIPLTDFRGNL